MVTDEQLARINELAKKQREQGLTPDEAAEQHQLRRHYIDSVKRSLKGHLDHIRPQGGSEPGEAAE